MCSARLDAYSTEIDTRECVNGDEVALPTAFGRASVIDVEVFCEGVKHLTPASIMDPCCPARRVEGVRYRTRGRVDDPTRTFKENDEKRRRDKEREKEQKKREKEREKKAHART